MKIVTISRFTFSKLRYTSIRSNHTTTKKNVKILYKNDIVPKTTKKIFMPTLITKVNSETAEPPQKTKGKELRINEINMQMLSKNIYNQLFKNEDLEKPDYQIVESSRYELMKHGIKNAEIEYLDDINLKLPPLEGKNLIEHFKNIGEQQAKPYKELLNELLTELPKPPDKWSQKPGWTRYAPDSKPERVSHPLEDALVFDVEICLNAGKIPTMATAVSNKAWYGWVSKALIDEISKPINEHHFTSRDLIPLEKNFKNNYDTPEFKTPRIVAGHNVSFDRSKVKEQYYFEKSGTRFLDTMSLHICISGITSYQRAMLKSGSDTEDGEKWKNISSLNSLSEVHKLYCGSEISKTARNIFIEGSLSDIKNDFNNLMQYCANDVIATCNVLKVLYPMFLERFPHPVSFAGMIILYICQILGQNETQIFYINSSVAIGVYTIPH